MVCSPHIVHTKFSRVQGATKAGGKHHCYAPRGPARSTPRWGRPAAAGPAVDRRLAVGRQRLGGWCCLGTLPNHQAPSGLAPHKPPPRPHPALRPQTLPSHDPSTRTTPYNNTQHSTAPYGAVQHRTAPSFVPAPAPAARSRPSACRGPAGRPSRPSAPEGPRRPPGWPQRPTPRQWPAAAARETQTQGDIIHEHV